MRLNPEAKFTRLSEKILVVASIIILLLLFIVAVILGYVFSWSWIGVVNYKQIEFKTLWDWMQALLIPLVLAVGVWWLNKSERENEQKIATDKQQQDMLEAYLDRMTDLLLNHDLQVSDKDNVKKVARTRTLTALRSLDGRRKGILIQFLCEGDLVNPKDASITPVIDLSHADLSSANLRGLSLHWAKLRQANMQNSDLTAANLIEATLIEANISHANLGQANLSVVHAFRSIMTGANLQESDLRGADLRDAKMMYANLQEADLRGAKMNNANLEGANLRGAYLDNTSLEDAILVGVDLRDTPNRQTSLTKTVLHRADLSRAKVTALSQFRGALLKATVMPDGNKLDAEALPK